MLQTIVTVLLVLSSLILIASILLQSGKSVGLGSIGGGAEQIWGKNKARDYDAKFDKITKVAAVLFIVSSLAMAYIQ